MNSTHGIVLHGFHPGGGIPVPVVHERGRTAVRSAGAGWIRLLMTKRRGHGSSDAGLPTGAMLAPPRRDRPLPFC